MAERKNKCWDSEMSDQYEKSSFVALLMGTLGGVLFALGMCMALLPEWNVFLEGVIFCGIGLVLGLITLIVWCKLEDKFVDAYLTKEGETVEDAKERLKKDK